VRQLVSIRGLASEANGDTDVIEVGVHEAKTNLSRLLRAVADGEEVVIRRGREPIARLVPVAEGRSRVLGEDVGRYDVPDDFDAPLVDDELERFGA
jgi:prevent-host-death family protein